MPSTNAPKSMRQTINGAFKIERTLLAAAFIYDGDGNRVQDTVNGVTTVYVNSSYEVSGGVGTSYYFAEGQRIAMRRSGVVSYLLPDHLGSTMLTTSSSGVKTAEQWYKAWGEVRYSSGSLQTKYTYTGQYSNTSDFGLMYYNARWYDPLLSRFAQADTVIPQPGNPQDWNRYSYVKNSPANYTDPSGHMVACGTDAGNGCAGFGPHEIINAGYDTEKADSLLRSFFETHPEYVVEMDPLIYGQNEEFIVRTVLFQVEVGRMPSFDERLQIELEKPMYEPLLANQYTPVVTSAMSVLATDAQYLSLAIPHPAQPLTFGLSYLLGRATGLVSLASTSYQYKHNLYGTTKTDAEIAAATTLVGAIPKPDMAIMVHVGFFYTVLRTFGAIPSP